MKILMVQDIGWLYGGGEIYVNNIKKELEKRGHIVKVFSSNINLKNNKEKQIADYLCYGTNGKFAKLMMIFNPFALFKIKKILKEFKPDIVHIHSFFYNLSPSILIPAKKFPTVMTLHNYILFCMSGYKHFPNYECCNQPYGKICRKMKCVSAKQYYTQYLARLLINKLIKNIDLFIAVSSYVEKLAKQAGYTNVKMLNNAIDEKLFRFKKLPQKQRLFYCGRLVEEKGVKYLLQAIPSILNRFPKMHLDIAGSGPLLENLKALAKDLKIEKNVHFLGNIPNNKLEDYYHRSSIVFVPSIWPDNSPVVIYETMASGRPVIASNVGGIPDLIVNGITGCLIPPKNSEEIAKKTINLLKNKRLLERMGYNARDRVLKLFTMKKHINTLENIYNNLTKKYNQKHHAIDKKT